MALQSGTFYLGLEAAKKRTASWCAVALRAGSTAALLADGLAKSRPHPPLSLTATSSRIAAPAAPKKEKALQVATFATLEAAADGRVAAYLRGLLWHEPTRTVTPRFHAAITEVFAEYAGSSEGVLDLKDLDRLQFLTNQEPFGADNFAYSVDNYDAATLPSGKRGLTLRGLVQMYGAQADAEPLETWLELANLGFDLALERGAFLAFAAALHALHPALPVSAHSEAAMDVALPEAPEPEPWAVEQEVVRYAEAVVAELPGLRSPLLLHAHDLPLPAARPARPVPAPRPAQPAHAAAAVRGAAAVQRARGEGAAVAERGRLVAARPAAPRRRAACSSTPSRWTSSTVRPSLPPAPSRACRRTGPHGRGHAAAERDD